MDYAIEILLAVNTGILGLGTWFLYEIMKDVTHLKIFSGIAKTKITAMERRVEKLELIRVQEALVPHKR